MTSRPSRRLSGRINGGRSNGNCHPGYIFIRQATQFKINAQMQKELERHAMAKEALLSWDTSSTLFDKYKLDFVFKHLDLALGIQKLLLAVALQSMPIPLALESMPILLAL